MPDISRIIARAKNLPPLSPGAQKLLTLMGGDHPDLGQVVTLVECDPGLTAQVLQVVNSPAIGLRTPIASLARAVTYLGESLVVGMAMAASAPQVLHRTLDGYLSPRGAMWAHSLKAALASRRLCVHARAAISPDVAFTAGLLHDIGKAVLSEFLVDYQENLLAGLTREGPADYLAAEAAATGVDHCRVGAELARHWNLPANLGAAIRHHHQPALAPPAHRSLAYLVHLGDITAMLSGSGTGLDALCYRLDRNYAAHLRLGSRDLEKIMMEVYEEFATMQNALWGGEDDGPAA
ncbi:MAG: HDOD domain-containing protein [Deltaproteobacteria bacterium]|nr:HDOD domain-containing protein [Deltaproteobacteria bacterium]